ncbi:MAG: hypothetical protein ACHQAQ_11525 [Hyphomicrobiales bacterium]
MSKDDRRRSQSDAASPHWRGRIMFAALLALVFALCLIAGRDGIAQVIPDLWASAGTIGHMLGVSDWPFG